MFSSPSMCLQTFKLYSKYDLGRFNKALLGKWLWCYGSDREALWSSVVDVKYGSLWGSWCLDVGKGPYGVSLWKFIRRGWDTFYHLCSFVVGDGQKVKFWHDSWCGHMFLKEEFLELFVISWDKDASMAHLMSFPDGLLHWHLRFSRNVQDWELESLSIFMDLIYSLPLRVDGEDQFRWRLKPNKGLRSRSITVVCVLTLLSLSLGRAFGRPSTA